MDQRKEEITRRPLYVYDLPQDILSTLSRKDPTEEVPNDHVVDAVPKETAVKLRRENAIGAKACSLCGVTFYTVDDQRSHNLDESLSGSDSSDSEDDENGDARKETTLSALLKKQAAISSNKEEGVDFTPQKEKRGSGKPPLLWFTTSKLPANTYLGIYRSIFTNSEQEDEIGILNTIQKKQLTPKTLGKIPANSNGVPLPEAYKGPHIFLCMIGGGHFAAMVVSLPPKQSRSSATGPLTKEVTVLAHKTFHRYTTRRKQGGAQSANDSAKGAAHSAGSSLRRYNEQALTDEVRLLLSDWKGMIDTSELLFIRATGNTNRRTLFGPYDGQVLRQNDPRIRGFSFSTRRATQNELMRSFVELTRVKVLEVDEASLAAAKAIAEETARASAASKTSKETTPATPKLSEEDETALIHTNQIQALIRRSKLPALLSYLKSNNLSPDFPLYPQDSQQSYHAPTPLHLAASQNSVPLVSGLIIKGGANPTLPNGDGKTPFDLAGNRSTRDAFRVARSELGENNWDWEAAHIPSALTKSEVEERDAREKKEDVKQEDERRQAEAARLKEEGPKTVDGPLGKAAGRGRALALGQVGKTAQERREEEARGLTPEMRIRLERERRARAAEERMRRIAGGS